MADAVVALTGKDQREERELREKREHLKKAAWGWGKSSCAKRTVILCISVCIYLQRAKLEE